MDNLDDMELILQNKESLIPIPELMAFAVQDELDMKWLNTLEDNMVFEATGLTNHKNTETPFGEEKLINSSVVEDGKDNFLMPAPRGRLPRIRKTKSTVGDGRMLRDAELSVTEPRKSRRTTRKGKEKAAPRPSTTTRASTRTSYKCRPSVSGARVSIGQKAKRKTLVLDDSVTSGETRMTRSKVANVSVIQSSFKVDSPVLEKSPKELGYEVNRIPEVNDNSVTEDEMEVLENETYQVGDNCHGAMEVDEEEVHDANQAKKGEEAENEADEEWMSDDGHEEKSRTPKAVKPVELKIVVPATGSHKALRSRKVQNASLDLPLAHKSKSSHATNNVTSVTPIQQRKPVEIEVKEAELKKKMEKEEAVKRKEEIMKKRTEAAKRKREEKMAKVKRTREEQEKERKQAKGKVRKEKKQPVASPEPELEPIKSPPPKVATPHGDFNVTYDVMVQEEHEVDAYNLTPCWEDRPPVQPDNPNDYGMVDKSDCSSEEDNDPRKKIPVWAQLKSDDPKLLSQALLPHSFINEYWHCKPRAPTIKEFFGSQVSKRTRKRGLNYRTSSACWNTPPSRKLGI